jgi:hypothetical protein
MTEAEVEAILGPPGDFRYYGPGQTVKMTLEAHSGLHPKEWRWRQREKAPDGRPRLQEKSWWGHTFVIKVAFNEDGAVIGRCFGRLSLPHGLSPPQKAVAWLLP